ncbi:calcium load-activated calcium channel isoform X2 [Zalophus californianus]|uniref:Calcium load-activated calcium channel n=1 Tax=Zalophus californianus TaxID=9704 RepID=A0A6J2EL96_ZALCA|nr:calcium load-activated calcium channel isoform X2 [Zalophus californianus]XP_027960468.1 calcium load-activated calcium channel isoform X2 [Eumetopias jubatus]
MSTMFADTLLIVFISVCTALLAEGITWVLVYRTDKYKRLKAEVEKQSKKLEKKKETITESAGRQQKKKIERQEEKLKNNNRDLSMVRMKSMFAIGFCFTALMGMFNSIVQWNFPEASELHDVYYCNSLNTEAAMRIQQYSIKQNIKDICQKKRKSLSFHFVLEKMVIFHKNICVNI